MLGLKNVSSENLVLYAKPYTFFLTFGNFMILRMHQKHVKY